MTCSRCKDTLDRINKLDPYWQKFEWWDIKDSEPDFYRELLAYSEQLNDRSEKTETDSL